MNWNLSPFRGHCLELSKELGRQAFWKTALFGVLLLERQWPVYEKLSLNRPWGASKEVRQVLDRLWKGVPTGTRLDDKYLLMLEENSVESFDEPWNSVAACMITDSLALIHIFRHKDKKAAGTVAEENLQCLKLFLDACGEECSEQHPLVAAELAFQRELCQRLCEVPNKDKTAFIAQCREENTGSLLGECWFPDYQEAAPMKRKAKKLPALRYTHVRYDDYVEEAKKTDKDGLNAWEREKRQFELFDIWLNWQDKMPNDCNVQHPLIQHVIRRWPMPECFAEVIGLLPVGAESCWACTEDPELVRGLFWLQSRAQEACYSLLEKGWPCSEYLAHENSMCRKLTNPAFHAICAGDWELAERLLKRIDRPFTLRGTPAPWRQIPATRVWLALIQGNDEWAGSLIEEGTRSKCPPTYEEELWPHLYQWHSWEEDCEIFRMLLNRDKKGLEKEIIGNIRSLRDQYELNRVTLSVWDLTLWKLARRRGIELDLPAVSELPAALLEDKPLDAEKWKLPGQAVLDEALGSHGMELLERWTQLALI